MLAAYHFGVERRLLDVGCAAGFFVAEAQKDAWEASGIDLSREMVSWGRSHVVPDLSAAMFSSLPPQPSSFGLVTMWDYIEHSVDPRADITHACEILEPGGLLAVSTGDIESLVARLSRRRWHLLTPRHHNYFFGRRTLRAMLERCGFDVLATTHEAAWYSAAHLVYKLEALLPEGIGRRLSHRLRRSRVGELEVPVNLYDIVTVVGRKRASAS